MNKILLFTENYRVKLNSTTMQEEIMDLCGNFVEKNHELFVESAKGVFKSEGKDLNYDYAEIKSMEYPELDEIKEEDFHLNVKVLFPYILDLWKEKVYLGAIQADCEAYINVDCTFTEKGLIDRLKSIEVNKLHNTDAYFDMYIP